MSDAPISRPPTPFERGADSAFRVLTMVAALAAALACNATPLRGADKPLVIAGGPTATHPEPVSAFFDVIVVGDGEEALTEVALAWVRQKRESVPRDDRLRNLAKLSGVYVPSLYSVTANRFGWLSQW